jgi:hypothetical protein
MDVETQSTLADILRILTEIERKLSTLAEQLGVDLD